MRRSLLVLLLALTFAAPSMAQLGICSTTPLESTDFSGKYTKARLDPSIAAVKQTCQLDLQDWPLAAEALNLTGATVVRIPFGTSDPATCEDEDLFLRSDTERLRICTDGATNTWADLTGTGGGGSSIILDLGDDASNESTGVTEIATSGDTNSIFTEPSADKLLVNLANNWPSADTADALSANGGNCLLDESPTGVDAAGASESCLHRGDINGDGSEDITSSTTMVLRPNASGGSAALTLTDSSGSVELTASPGIILLADTLDSNTNIAADNFQADTYVQLDAGACLRETGNRMWHDTDCDGTKEAGEEWIDQAGSNITVREEDGTPSVSATTIRFANGTLTDNGGGDVSVSNSGSSTQVDIDGDSTREIDLASSVLQFDPDEDGTDEFVMDGVNDRLGVGTNAPTDDLHVVDNGPARAKFTNSTTGDEWVMGVNSTGDFLFAKVGSTTNELFIDADSIRAGLPIQFNYDSNIVDLDLSGDRLYHDTDSDGTQDAGERFIDGFYHPDRPPVSCYECEEWEGGADDLTGWTERGVNASSVLSYQSRGLHFDVVADSSIQAYMRAAPTAQDFVVSSKVGGRLDDDGGGVGIAMVVEGTEASPTRIFSCEAAMSSGDALFIEYSNYTTFTATTGTFSDFVERFRTAAQDAEILSPGVVLQMRWDDSEDDLSCWASYDGVEFYEVSSTDLTAAGDAPVSHGVFANVSSSAREGTNPLFHYFRVRTDTAGLAGEAGE